MSRTSWLFVGITVWEIFLAILYRVQENTEREQTTLLAAILFAILALVFKDDRDE